MRTLEYTLPDGSTGTASPDDVAKAVEALLMDGTMVMDSKELQVALEQARASEARHTAIIRAVVERAVERGVVTR
jgi:thiamine pyrophosphate-dependent acetolactate synthase large subunit-like protein